MKRVFGSNYELAHVWASQSQDRGDGNSMHFEGPTVYSFRWWPMATFVKNKKGETRVLVRQEGYGSYTGRHQSYVRSAINHLPTIPVWPGRQNGNMDWLDLPLARKRALEVIAASLASAKRARKYTQMHLDHAQAVADAYNELALFLGGKFKPIYLDGELDKDIAKLQAEAAAQRKWDAQERKKREAERAAQEEARLVEAKVDLALWLKGGSVERWRFNNLPCALRIKDNEIETSHGAAVPLSYARRLWTLIEACRAAHAPYYPKEFTVGSYRLNEVTATGDLQVGCHFIPYESIVPIAVQLGFTTEEVSNA
jgi:hypothetical protein